MVNAPMTIISASFFLALSSITFADDYQVRTDKSIEASAAARAAERIGDIRGTISYDQVPALMTPSDLEPKMPKAERQSDLSPRPSWVPPEKDAEALPPLVTRDHIEGLDQTLTGSIKRSPSKRRNFEWDIFDKDGNRITLD